MQEAHLVCITVDPAVITWENYLGFLCRNVCITQTPVAKQFLLKQPVYAQYSVLLRSSECHENLLTASLPVLEFQGLSVTRGGGDGYGGWALNQQFPFGISSCCCHPDSLALPQSQWIAKEDGIATTILPGYNDMEIKISLLRIS